MERFKFITAARAALVFMLLSACAPPVIPKDLEGQVDRNVSFLQVKEAPSSYQHRTIALGGEVLSVTRDGDNTRVQLSYNVGGFIDGGFDKIAPAVESMLNEQLNRLKLFAETGKPTREQ